MCQGVVKLSEKAVFEKVTAREKYGYGVGCLGHDMCYALVGSFFMNYCTDQVGVSPLFMGILFFFARIWDAINDPMMGIIVDNTKNKFGKYRTWILAGGVSNSIILIFLFTDPSRFASSDVAKCVYIGTLYVIWGMTYTLMDVPYWSFVSAISPDPKIRNEVSTIPRIFSGIGQALTQVGTFSVVAWLGSTSIKQGYFRWACIIAFLFTFFCVVCVCCIKERPIVNQDKRFSFKEAIQTLKNNDQLMYLVLVLILINMAMNMATSVAVYYFKYSWYDGNSYSVFASVVGVAIFVGMLLYAKLAKKFDKKKLFVFGMLVPVIAFIAMVFLSSALRELEVSKRLICFMIPAFIFCPGFGLVNVATTVMIADTVDYGEWKLGYRSECIIFSMQTFMVKFATAFVGLITGIGLSIAGFDLKNVLADTANTDEALTAAINGLQAAGVLDNVQTTLDILMFAFPPALLLLGAFIYIRKYKLNNSYMERISGELIERRAETNEQ